MERTILFFLFCVQFQQISCGLGYHSGSYFHFKNNGYSFSHGYGNTPLWGGWGSGQSVSNVFRAQSPAPGLNILLTSHECILLPPLYIAHHVNCKYICFAWVRMCSVQISRRSLKCSVPVPPPRLSSGGPSLGRWRLETWSPSLWWGTPPAASPGLWRGAPSTPWCC